jgi:transcriptional regulator with XRE-family HTH domain
MKIDQSLPDDAVLRELGGRLAAARLARNLTQTELAAEAGVAKRTLERLEAGQVATQLSGFVRVCRALGLLDRLEALLPVATSSPLAELELKGRRRQRASGGQGGKRRKAAPPWSWGDS